MRPGDVISVYVSVPFQGFEVGFENNIRIVRYEPSSGTIGAEFAHLDQRSQELLETFVREIVSGEMEVVDGVLRRLDVPVTPISIAQERTPQSDEIEEEKRRRGLLFYVVAGLLLTAILATVIYTNFIQLKIDTAVVMGTNDVINAPTAGTVSYIADLHSSVNRGAPVLSITDYNLEYDIAMADLNVKNAYIEKKRLDSLLQQRREYASTADSVVSKQWEAASNLINSLEKDLQTKGELLRKTRDLLSKGMGTLTMLQKVQSDYMETERLLNQARLDQVALDPQINARRNGGQAGGSFELYDIQALATAAEEKLALAKSELDFLVRRKDALTITAPTDGRLVRLFTPLSSSVKFGDPIAIFERSGNYVIQAFLTQQEALYVVKGQSAKAYVPNRWWSIPVRVRDIDYYSLTINQTQGHFQWVNLLNAAFKTVIVTLEPINSKDFESMQEITPGTAVTVVF